MAVWKSNSPDLYSTMLCGTSRSIARPMDMRQDRIRAGPTQTSPRFTSRVGDTPDRHSSGWSIADLVVARRFSTRRYVSSAVL